VWLEFHKQNQPYPQSTDQKYEFHEFHHSLRHKFHHLRLTDYSIGINQLHLSLTGIDQSQLTLNQPEMVKLTKDFLLNFL